MTRAALTPVVVVPAGVAYSLTQPSQANGNSLANYRGAGILLVANAAGAPITVTIKANGSIVGGMPVSDRVVTVANGAARAIGLPESQYCVQTDGNVYIDWSSDTSITCAVLFD